MVMEKMAVDSHNEQRCIAAHFQRKLKNGTMRHEMGHKATFARTQTEAWEETMGNLLGKRQPATNQEGRNAMIERIEAGSWQSAHCVM